MEKRWGVKKTQLPWAEQDTETWRERRHPRYSSAQGVCHSSLTKPGSAVSTGGLRDGTRVLQQGAERDWETDKVGPASDDHVQGLCLKLQRASLANSQTPKLIPG